MRCKRTFTATVVLTSCLAFPHLASASLYLDPGGSGTMDGSSLANGLKEILTGPQTSQAQINVAIAATLGSSTELYKQNFGSPLPADTGAFATSYSTVFSNPANDPGNALISYVSGPAISAATHLLVKDGNNSPAWYLYNISGWNGTMNIVLSDFWPGRGAISHVTIYGGAGGGGAVPEATSLAVWALLIGSCGMANTRRRRA